MAESLKTLTIENASMLAKVENLRISLLGEFRKNEV